MIEQLRKHIEFIFENAPKTREAFDLKEELLANSIERFQDIVESGVSSEDAYQNVISSIGNVEDLFITLKEPILQKNEINIWRRKSAFITSISIGLYIVAAIALIAISALFNQDVLGLLIALAISIIPTCMLVYSALAYPSYKGREDTVVENFKQWSSKGIKRKEIRHAISSIIWLLCLIIYFLVSFITGAWYITWIIFLITSCIEGIVTLIFHLKELK